MRKCKKKKLNLRFTKLITYLNRNNMINNNFIKRHNGPTATDVEKNA